MRYARGNINWRQSVNVRGSNFFAFKRNVTMRAVSTDLYRDTETALNSAVNSSNADFIERD